jgi:hypothetical protein
LFFSLTAAHYQIPIYLTFTTCLTLTGLIALARSRQEVAVLAALSIAASLVGLFMHAGQPVSRGFAGVVRGDRVNLDAPSGIPRASVAMEKADAETYSRIVSDIERYSAPDETILSLPFDPEFYFLSQRRSAFRFLGTSFGIHDQDDLAAVQAEMMARPPRVVINRRVDKYHTPLSLRLVETIKRDYRLLEAVGDFDIYVANR